MKKSLIKFHYSFFIFLVLSFLFNKGWLFVEYFICLVFHEWVHSLVARKRGYEIGRIKLMATGAVLEAESDEFGFNDEVIIAISGPLFNLTLCFLTMAVWWIFPESYNYTQDFCVINLAIFAFNILPVFPLDGGRVLLAMLSKGMERKKAVRISRLITIIIAFCIFGLFIVSLFSYPNFSFAIASIMLIISGFAEDKQAFYKRSLLLMRKRKRMKRGIEGRNVFVDKDIDLFGLFKLLDARHYTIFYLLDEQFNICSRIEESEVIEKIKDEKRAE